jgi:TetR/AcrR family transcriptional regulator of autoinduction and epiphytic fitness
VRDAAVHELGERGWGSFTVDGVAARAGVARSTVYRHWPDRRALLAEALEHHSTQPPKPPEGTARQRVEQLVAHLAERFADPVASSMAVALIDAAERDPDVRTQQQAFARRRRQALVDALEAGIRAGEVRPLDPELVAAALAGAVVYRRVGHQPLGPDEVGTLVESVLGPEPTS